MAERLSREELERRRAEHHRKSRAGGWCVVCQGDWPCDAIIFLSHIDALEQELVGSQERAKRGDRAVMVLRMVQWYKLDDNLVGGLCLLCEQPESNGHSPDCLIGTVLDQEER